jgi:hypothetical protein
MEGMYPACWLVREREKRNYIFSGKNQGKLIFAGFSGKKG